MVFKIDSRATRIPKGGLPDWPPYRPIGPKGHDLSSFAFANFSMNKQLLLLLALSSLASPGVTLQSTPVSAVVLTDGPDLNEGEY